MARGVNKVILIGNLGQDPEVRYFPSGGAVCNVTLATTDSWKDKQSGEMKEATEWHRVTFNNRLAEIAGEYLRKGSKVYVEGSLRTRKWQNQQGQEQYTTEIRANEMQMLDARGGQQGGGQQGGYQPQGQDGGFAPQQQAPQQMGGYQQQPTQGGGFQQQAPQHSPQQAPQYQAPTPPTGGYQQQAPQPAAAPSPAPAQQAAAPKPAEPNLDFDDDIPF